MCDSRDGTQGVPGNFRRFQGGVSQEMTPSHGRPTVFGKGRSHNGKLEPAGIHHGVYFRPEIAAQGGIDLLIQGLELIPVFEEQSRLCYLLICFCRG